MKLPFSTLWAEFKAFAFQGNMLELAVAVVIGGAFSTVIHAMVTDIINPTIGYAVEGVRSARDTATEAAHKATETVGLTHATTHPATTQAATAPAVVVAAAAPAPPPAPAAAEPAKAVQFEWMVGHYPIGHFIGELINFLILAFAVFILIVKLLGGMVKRVGGAPKPGEPTTRECPECLSIIPIKARRCSHCTAVLEVPPEGATTTA